MAEDWALDQVAAPAEAVRAGAAAPEAAGAYGMRVSRQRRPEQAAEERRAVAGPEEVRVAAVAQAVVVRAPVDLEVEMGEA